VGEKGEGDPMTIATKTGSSRSYGIVISDERGSKKRTEGLIPLSTIHRRLGVLGLEKGGGGKMTETAGG